MNLKPIAKAVTAAAGAALFAGAAALGTGLSDGHGLSSGEAGIALGAACTAFAVVGRATWRVPNAE